MRRSSVLVLVLLVALPATSTQADDPSPDSRANHARPRRARRRAPARASRGDASDRATSDRTAGRARASRTPPREASERTTSDRADGHAHGSRATRARAGATEGRLADASGANDRNANDRNANDRPASGASPAGSAAALTFTPAAPITPAAAAATSFTPALPQLPIRPITSEEAWISGVASAAVLGAALAPWPNAQTGWRGGILFDDAARNAMMLHDPNARHTASLVSDGMVLGLTALPVLVDSAIIAWAVRGDPELAARMLLIDLQAHAIAQGVTSIVKHLAGRERPMARGCREDPQRAATDPSCQGSANPGIAPQSFFSGHTSLAFTSAALMCLHHTELGLLGQAGDAAMCATGLAMAGMVGALRIMSDYHYASDVLVGAGVGLLSGWLVPWLLHYDIADEATNGAVHATISPMVNGNQFGLQIFGTF